MLWNIVYEFFVRYIFGGYLTIGEQDYAFWSTFAYDSNGTIYYLNKTEITLFGSTITLGNYFAFLATFISMVVIVFLCCLLIKKIYNMCAHVIG